MSASPSDSLPPISRRRLLGACGLAASTLGVTGAGYLTWRATDGGVFGTGTGPAYTAWDAWDRRTPRTHDLVAAAVLAANAHNTQPWLFRVSDNRIDLFADTRRGLGAMDPLGRELHLSLGCALENLTLAAEAHAGTPTVTLLPDPANPAHVARVDLAPTRAATPQLYPAIGRRHTDRGAYHTDRPVGPATRDALARLAGDGTQVRWLAGAEQRAEFSALTVKATQAIIADPQQSHDDFAWYRTDWHQIQEHKDGVTVDASGQPAWIRAAAKLLPTTRAQNDDGWLRATRDTQLPTAAAFGVLALHDPLDRAALLTAGRAWQRIHLAATLRGLAAQPLCQVPERIDRERSAGLPQRFTTGLAALLPAGSHAVMTFRIGYPTTRPPRSPRRPARAVLLA